MAPSQRSQFPISTFTKTPQLPRQKPRPGRVIGILAAEMIALRAAGHERLHVAIGLAGLSRRGNRQQCPGHANSDGGRSIAADGHPCLRLLRHFGRFRVRQTAHALRQFHPESHDLLSNLR